MDTIVSPIAVASENSDHAGSTCMEIQGWEAFSR